MTRRFFIRLYYPGLFFIAGFIFWSAGYPIDGYKNTGIRRLLRLEKVVAGEIKESQPLPTGAMKKLEEIQLHLASDSIELFFPMETDPVLQKALDRIFPGLHESYSLALLDITPGRDPRFAIRKELRGYQPGSVGKLAVMTGLFCELENIFPDSFEKRKELLKTKFVEAGSWALSDHHTVPVFDTTTNKLTRRVVQAKDVFSLYEWIDYMMSVSNNSAASIVWREVMLMYAFGEDYPTLSKEKADEYFKITPKNILADVANRVVNQPLRDLGISEDEWRLGSFFTRGANQYVPDKGGSIGTTLGLMKFLVAMEQGNIIDKESSLEMKRLMYMTDRRIRYASSPVLKESAVYFKSGSLYQCVPEEGYTCTQYMGNKNNYMNSVAIVEHPDSTTYLVCLMSNVLKRNSAGDHLALASRIDQIVRAGK